jgi:protein required for attachment to host cells
LTAVNAAQMRTRMFAVMQFPQWFLVANAARARLLSRARNEPLQLVRAFGHVESRAKSTEPRAGAFEPRISAREKERHRFAHELARFIDREAREGHFASLSVFAPSPFLGDLKHELGAATVHRLAAAEDLDLTHKSLTELEQSLDAASPT